jgi:hypothetical protein
LPIKLWRTKMHEENKEILRMIIEAREEILDMEEIR